MYTRALAAIAATAVLSIAAVVAPAAPASAHVGTDPRLTEALMAISINTARVSHGLPPLQFDGALSDSARAWSGQMAATGTLSHTRTLASTVSGAWTAIAENVGDGPHPPAIQDAFMASPIHRENILGNYTRMGIGVVVDRAGIVWVTQRFVR
jgi:uncharacterized protein YkwD